MLYVVNRRILSIRLKVRVKENGRLVCVCVCVEREWCIGDVIPCLGEVEQSWTWPQFLKLFAGLR
jgi:hypothetical protein